MTGQDGAGPRGFVVCPGFSLIPCPFSRCGRRGCFEREDFEQLLAWQLSKRPQRSAAPGEPHSRPLSIPTERGGKPASAEADHH
jgi:hypothetical protein